MPLIVTCPRCGARARTPDSAAGETRPCPNCRLMIAVPVVELREDGPPEPPRRKSRDAGGGMAGPVLTTAVAVGLTLALVAGVALVLVLAASYLDWAERERRGKDPRPAPVKLPSPGPLRPEAPKK